MRAKSSSAGSPRPPGPPPSHGPCPAWGGPAIPGLGLSQPSAEERSTLCGGLWEGLVGAYRLRPEFIKDRTFGDRKFPFQSLCGH